MHSRMMFLLSSERTFFFPRRFYSLGNVGAAPDVQAWLPGRLAQAGGLPPAIQRPAEDQEVHGVAQIFRGSLQQ